MSTDVTYLQSLKAIRDRASLLLKHPECLQHFDCHLDRLDATVQLVADLIRRDYASPKDVPPHGRWRHFDVNGVRRIDQLLADWQQAGIDRVEQARKLLDLFVVSVLLDAGAGDKWKYHEASTGCHIGRSEGLALASLDMFKSGTFSSNPHSPLQVDFNALRSLDIAKLSKGLQVDATSNPLFGLEGRCQLLNRLGDTVASNERFFSGGRPGGLVDYLLANKQPSSAPERPVIAIDTLWHLVIHGFGAVWPPTRTKIGNVCLGDVWPCDALKHLDQTLIGGTAAEHRHLIPFHKLSQWLSYSLMEPMETLLNVKFDGLGAMTGLAEYRNAGLLVDMGVLTLRKPSFDRGMAAAKDYNQGKPASEHVPLFEVFDPVIVEWRALTLALLDEIGSSVRKTFGLSAEEMPLVKVLEGGTWKAGREMAAKYRPQTRGPPIQIVSDGTVF